MTITEPEELSGLSQFTSLHYVKLRGLLGKCQDWEWVKNNESLEDVDVSLRHTDSETFEEEMHVHGEIATLHGMSENGLMKFLHNLPDGMCKKVRV